MSPASVHRTPAATNYILHLQNFNWEENAKSVPGLLERVDAPISPAIKSRRSSAVPSLSTTPPSSPQHSSPPQCNRCGPNSTLHTSDQCPGRPSRAFRSSLKVNISTSSDRDRREPTPEQQLAAQADDIDQARLQHAVTRADTLFAQHVALDGTKAVERHRLAARKTGLQHRYVTTKQHGVYEAIREIPDIRPSKPRRQRRNGQHIVPVNNSHRRPVNRVPKPAPAPVVHNATWRKQHRADTPRPPGFGANRRVHFAPTARLHQGPVYQNPSVFTRLDNNPAYQGHYQLAP